ncbi:MAG: sigma-70 family RNA polymerase sigma factor [Nannocystaceae bacterium]|nr:sigma-70 family RNA polymerase sigma factor [Nannocystaceae bacterium]
MAGSDAELFAAWRQGGAVAGDALARRHYQPVLRFFEYRTGQAAEDLVQRTFAACAASLATYRGDGSFRGFLFGIARNVLLNHLRSRRYDDAMSRLDGPETGSSRTGMSTIISRRDEQRVLLQALVALPEELQTPLVLFYWEDLKAQEFADALGCVPSTARGRLARAREGLRRHIEEFASSGSTRERLAADVDGWLRSLTRDD